MNILIYDVETANNSNIGSICAVGWTLIQKNEVAETGYSLINPQCVFSRHCVAVHGISSKDVENAPTFKEYWNKVLAEKMLSSLVVSHNAGFDMAATEQALFNSELNDPGIDYMDSLAVFKSLVPCESYKLTDLAAMAGYTYKQHDALEDSKALAFVLKYLASQMGYMDIPDMLLRSHVASQNTQINSFEPKTIASHNTPSRTHCHVEVEAITTTLSGLRICLTGDVPGINREDIEKMIMQCGGKPTSSVSGKTDYLVVGVYEDYGPSFVSSKQKKALELIDQGAKIKVIDFKTLAKMMKGIDETS